MFLHTRNAKTPRKTWRGWFWLFHLATLVVGFRFLFVYFQVFGALSYTGFGLIVSGLLIIGVTLFWHRSKQKLENLITAGEPS